MEEFPPDPSRGSDLPAATVTVVRAPHGAAGTHGVEGDGADDVCSSPLLREVAGVACAPTDSRRQTVSRVFSESLLLATPSPDFSMPYNVITLSSTVATLLFGSVFNIFVRKRAVPATRRRATARGGAGAAARREGGG
jgi:phosphatidylinositol glycan class T